MSVREDIKKLEAELEEAQNWVAVSRGQGWADEWLNDVQLQLNIVRAQGNIYKSEEKPIKNWPEIAKRALAACLMTIALLLSANATCLAIVDDSKAIKAILGEARGEGYAGMYAVACAIRNRGHLKGVYGLKAKMPDLTARLWQVAAKAWAESEYGADVTIGANHWENVHAFGTPYWAVGLQPTATIGNHKFYRVEN